MDYDLDVLNLEDARVIYVAYEGSCVAEIYHKDEGGGYTKIELDLDTRRVAEGKYSLDDIEDSVYYILDIQDDLEARTTKFEDAIFVALVDPTCPQF